MSENAQKGFSWVPFFEELGEKLLDYEARQAELIDLLERAGVKAGLEDQREGRRDRLSEVDPFTFFSLILKLKKDENRTAAFRAIKAQLRLESPVPSDYLGVPTPNPLSAWLFAFAERRASDDVPTLWRLARAAIDQTIDEALWAKALAVRKVAMPKLTQAIFWLRPQNYLPIDAQTRPYLEKKGLKLQSNSWADYAALLDRVREALKVPFYKISHDAWQSNRDESGDSIDIRLSQGAITNGYVNVPKQCSIFDAEHFGGKTEAEAGTKFRLMLPNGEQVETDIRVHGGSRRIRARFYSLFKESGLEAGAVVRLSRLDEDEYEMTTLEQERATPPIHIDEALLALAVERKIRPVLLDQGGLKEGGEEGYHHHKILPRAQPLLSEEAIKEDPVGSLKGALGASVNLLSQFELVKANHFLEICAPDELRPRALNLLYGTDELESRVREFLDWAGTAQNKTEEGSVGFNATCVSEPPRFSRRQFRLSQAAMANSSCWR